MRSVGVFIAAVITTFITQNTVMATDNHSLSQVAATIADAVATNDEEMIEKYATTYEDMIAISIKQTKSEFQKAKNERKKRIDLTWREIREANILPDKVQIAEVDIQILEDTTPDRYLIVATVFPIVTIKGKATPVPLLSLHFVQIKDQWKYWY